MSKIAGFVTCTFLYQLALKQKVQFLSNLISNEYLQVYFNASKLCKLTQFGHSLPFQ